jgi:hypothetical protein
MDQPTAGEALKRLEELVGEWILEAKPPDGPPWPGEARATIEWHDSGAHLVQRSTVEMPEAHPTASRSWDATEPMGPTSNFTPMSAASAASTR